MMIPGAARAIEDAKTVPSRMRAFCNSDGSLARPACHGPAWVWPAARPGAPSRSAAISSASESCKKREAARQTEPARHDGLAAKVGREPAGYVSGRAGAIHEQ